MRMVVVNNFDMDMEEERENGVLGDEEENGDEEEEEKEGLGCGSKMRGKMIILILKKC